MPARIRRLPPGSASVASTSASAKVAVRDRLRARHSSNCVWEVGCRRAAGEAVDHADELAGLREGEAAEQECVGETEDCGGTSDSDGEEGDGGEREGRRFAEGAGRVDEVREDAAEHV